MIHQVTIASPTAAIILLSVTCFFVYLARLGAADAELKMTVDRLENVTTDLLDAVKVLRGKPAECLSSHKIEHHELTTVERRTSTREDACGRDASSQTKQTCRVCSGEIIQPQAPAPAPKTRAPAGLRKTSIGRGCKLEDLEALEGCKLEDLEQFTINGAQSMRRRASTGSFDT